MQVLHFSGRFVFQMPLHNNDPTNKKVEFDPNAKTDDVFRVCGCDPSRYFEFYFRNVRVNQATYTDGTSTVKDDSIVGQRLFLNAIMPDVSPSAVCGQLYAGTLKVGNLLSGSLYHATQSDLRTNVRPLDAENIWSSENAGAYFETILEVTDKTSPRESRFLLELGDVTHLEFYMHLNRYTTWNTFEGSVKDRLNGDVYGYIRPTSPVIDSNGVRIKARRLVAHPDIKNDPEIKRIFIGSSTNPLTRNTDIDGTYDIFKANRVLVLRYLDFVPLLDRCHNTPTDRGMVKEYIVLFGDRNNMKQTEVGRFKGDHKEMQRTGGILVFRFSDELSKNEHVLTIKVLTNAGDYTLMVESDLDIALESGRGVLEDKRGITLGSSQKGSVLARVYYQNRPVCGHIVRLITQNNNGSSPVVARFKESELSTNHEGVVEATVEAINLEKSDEIYDPVTSSNLKGTLPWDRYYGNYVYIAIDNPMRQLQESHVESIEIPVRVLHEVKAESISPGEISFKRDIYPKLLEYYVRYFPWIHVAEVKEDQYFRFLNLESYSSHDGVNDNIDDIVDRLCREDNDWRKMPRSRDFPIGGIELMKRWQAEGDKVGR
jgi:hypothetical protein